MTSMKTAQDKAKTRADVYAGAVRYLVGAVLLLAVCFEGYYIFYLRATVKQQTEDLRNISTQLQLLKSERKILNDELSSAKNQAGGINYGNSTQR